MATIVLNANFNDTFLAANSPGADSIYGLAGSETIEGGNGNDRIFGDRSPVVVPFPIGVSAVSIDPVVGAAVSYNDRLFGGNGLDWIYGDRGNDFIKGGQDSDRLYGGDGHDTISGGSGGDILEGGRGRDVLNGDRGNDVLRGGDGNDVMRGGAGIDLFNGGAGRDRVDFSGTTNASMEIDLAANTAKIVGSFTELVYNVEDVYG